MVEQDKRTDRARVLVLGASGLNGGAIVAELEKVGDIEVVRGARDPLTVAGWKDEGKAAVRIDLDDPRSFPAALAGIDRLFLMTGYTIHMVHQMKTITDAAADAGVGFIVHLGVFGNGRSTDPHFAWHELVERYIKGSSLVWASVHPHVFMENLLTVNRLQNGAFVWGAGDKRVGWVAGADIAGVIAKVLAEGPNVHAGHDYFLSTDLLNATEVAAILSSTLDREIPAVVITPQEVRNLVDAGHVAVPSQYDAAYAASALNWLQHTFDGRMDYSAVVTNTVTDLLSREPIHLAQWAQSH